MLNPKQIALVIILCLLSACTHLKTLPDPVPDNLPQPQRYYSTFVQGVENHPISITVYQPALNALESAPLVIQLHAFAIAGTKSPHSLSAKFMYSSKTALNLWKQGYWVISVDIRGHGKSGGTINLADPKQEVKDISKIIDWAEQNLPRLTKTPQQHAAVGLIGDSYGSGISLLASSFDARIKAIVSATGWYDLNQSLAPNGVPKIGWLKTPVLTGHFFNPGKLSPLIDQFYKDSVNARSTAAYSPALIERSPRFYCENNRPPQANTLILQGMRDILFDFNEGLALARCIENGGKDAHLIGIQDGHLEPFTQWGSRYTFYHIEDTVHCGDTAFSTGDLAIEWFNQHIKQQAPTQRIPKLCVTLSNSTGKTLNEFPRPNQTFEISSIKTRQNQVNVPAETLDYSGWLTPKGLVSYVGRPWSGTYKPLLIPLTVFSEQGTLLGTPSYDLSITEAYPNSASMGKHPRPKLFFGLGVIKNGKLTIINDQLSATYAPATIQGPKQTLAAQIDKGQTLYWVAFAYDHRRPLDNQWWTENLHITGKIHLPLPENLTPKSVLSASGLERAVFD